MPACFCAMDSFSELLRPFVTHNVSNQKKLAPSDRRARPGQGDFNSVEKRKKMGSLVPSCALALPLAFWHARSAGLLCRAPRKGGTYRYNGTVPPP